jgi:hypothetical protein
MVVIDFTFALLLALIISAVLILGFRRRGPGPLAGFLFFFILFFAAVWAGGIWLTPVGAPTWGATTSILSFLIAGIVLLLFIAAITPTHRLPRETPREAEVVATTITVFSIFFWILLVGLTAAILFRYLR